MATAARSPALDLLETRLIRSGVTAPGARECLAGKAITLLADRQRIAGMASVLAASPTDGTPSPS